MCEEIYKIIYENLKTPIKIHINYFCLLYSMYKAFKCRKIFKTKGTEATINCILNLKKRKLNVCSDIDHTLLKMRKIMVIHNILCKFFKKAYNCLEDSISLSACLVYLGFDVELVIGKSVNYVNQFYDFHAWITYKDIPINDTKQVLEIFYPVYRKSFYDK